MDSSSKSVMISPGLVFIIFALLTLCGCAAGKEKITGPVADVKHFFGVSQYYVKSNTVLHSHPDRSSKTVGKLPLNSKVTEITRNELGWSRVKSLEGNGQGWLPAALLSKQPVAVPAKTKAAKGKGEKVHAPEPQPATAAAVSKSEPAAEPDQAKPPETVKNQGLFSPKSAEAATIPEKPKPAAEETNDPRKADPDVFDAF